MPGIVITGHGGFATGLLQAVEQVVGPQPHCAAVDFPEQMSTAQLNDALRSALAAKTAQDMGLKPVAHIKGGFGAWRDAGGPIEAWVPKAPKG